jgi:hypothetical protein
MCKHKNCNKLCWTISIIIQLFIFVLSSTYIHIYNNPNPNIYDPSQDNIKAQYFNNLIYTYNGKFINYTIYTDINNHSIYNFNYFFSITDKTTRSIYNNDTFLCEKKSTDNQYMILVLKHLYDNKEDIKLYFYNNECMMIYPHIDGSLLNIIAILMVIICSFFSLFYILYCVYIM